MKKLLPVLHFLLLVMLSNAQSRYDSTAVAERFRKTDRILNILRDFRFKAFVQAEWQHADTAGINSAQGGNFPVAANNRFLLRQGRFILAWEHEIVNKRGDTIKIGQFSFNANMNEKGLTSLFDFYGRIFDPWTGWFSFRGGIFTVPFGFETPVYVDIQESPEQNRVNQSILPQESDLGGEIIIESPRTFKPFYLRADAGIVNGDGIQVNGEKGAYQSHKDFISRIWVGKFWDINSTTRFGFNASVSYYNGAVMQTDTAVYLVEKNAAGLPVFTNIAAGETTSWQNHVYEFARDYYGGHVELNLGYKIHNSLSATSMIRCEVIGGTQPGQQTSDMTPDGSGTTGTGVPGVNLYIRKFYGGGMYITQSFHFNAGKQLMHADITFKYDFFTPNTQIKGSDITGASLLSTSPAPPQGIFNSSADMSWNTFSGGVAFVPVPYLKILLWYDHVVNENTGLTGIYAHDYPKDDVFTIRTQFTIDSWWWDKKSNNPNLISKAY